MSVNSWLLLLGLLIPVTGIAQNEWLVPDDKKGKLSDFAFSDSTRQVGSQLYQINCKSCHGDPGKGNYQNLNPLPGDPATDKIQQNSDGELFYKLQEGRGLMPSFKNILSQEEIWMLVSYLRSYNSEYVQQVAEKILRGNLQFADLKILLTALDDHRVKAMVTGDENGVWNPVRDAEVALFVHRRFGQLPVDETKLTGPDGVVTFQIPGDLPGDTAGMLHILARLTDEEQFGVIKADTFLQVGLPFIPVSLTAERAMWNTMQMAPLWLLLSFGGALVLVLGLLGYVLLLLRKIFYAGKE